MLVRIGVILIVAFIALIEAAIIAVIKDYSKGNQQLFQRRLIIWAAWNSGIITAGYFLATGTLLGYSP